MPATSKSQQRLFGMVHAYKKGELDTKSINKDLLAKIKKIAGGIKTKSAKEFATTKHKGLPELKEARNMTFKQFLVELTYKERQQLIPPASVQKILKTLQKEFGTIKRDVFYRILADKFNLTQSGLERIIKREPWVHAIPFEDLQKDSRVAPRDPWTHVTRKHENRV